MHKIQIVKRDGKTIEEYNPLRVLNVLEKAFISAGYNDNAKDLSKEIIKDIYVEDGDSVEDIQDMIFEILLDYDYKDVAQTFSEYRALKQELREKNMLEQMSGLFDQSDEYLMRENANKKADLTNVQQSYLGEIAGTRYCRSKLFPKFILEAHDKGALHVHDLSTSAPPGITNCSLLDLEGALYYENGPVSTVMNDVGIDAQTKFRTVCTVATQIIQGVAGLQYGGITITLTHLVKAYKLSLLALKDDILKYQIKEADKYYLEKKAELLADGIQTFMYQVNSMFTTQGQTPFLTVCAYLNEAKTEEDKDLLAEIIEEVFKQRIKGFKDRYGNWVGPAFPKLIYMLQKDNVYEGSKYEYLTILAAQCNTNRVTPDYISEKVMKAIHNGHCYPSMGCRSFLSEWTSTSDPDAQTDTNKFYGRCNLGVVSLNLPYIAAESLNNKENFFDTLDRYAKIAHIAHQIRTKRICNTSIDCAPLLWRDGVFARCTKENAKIGDIVKPEYASVSLGYAGLYEMCTILGYKNHWTDGKDFAMKVMQKLNDYCKEWTLEDKLRYGVYGSPMESGTYKFAKALKSIYPSYDRLFITNSYHIPVFEKIDPFSKLTIEGEFQPLSKNGCISYIECADMKNNLQAIRKVQQHIYDHCMYAELNVKSCKCYTCGSEEPQEIDDDLVWYCPKCGERRPKYLRHLYRICGYASTNDSNDGRTSDVKYRYIHLDNHEL